MLSDETTKTRAALLALPQENLKRPIRVILFYITAVVLPDDGPIHFVEHI